MLLNTSSVELTPSVARWLAERQLQGDPVPGGPVPQGSCLVHSALHDLLLPGFEFRILIIITGLCLT